jgi:hypothetical protein
MVALVYKVFRKSLGLQEATVQSICNTGKDEKVDRKNFSCFNP